MKVAYEELGIKEGPIIDLNATVNEIDEPRGFATPGDGTSKAPKKSQKKLSLN
jgi:hypothetical protein